MKYCSCDWSDGGMWEFVTATCSRCGKPHPIAEMYQAEIEVLKARVVELERERETRP